MEMLVFLKEGKLEYPEKNPLSKEKINNKLKLHMELGRNRIRAILMEGERSHHCTIPAPRNKLSF